jgi:hypothetical protein
MAELNIRPAGQDLGLMKKRLLRAAGRLHKRMDKHECLSEMDAGLTMIESALDVFDKGSLERARALKADADKAKIAERVEAPPAPEKKKGRTKTAA